MQQFIEKAKLIRLAIFDVDGVLTDGALFYGNNTELKKFHVHDGLGMKLLMKSGVEIAIITSRQSDIVTQRMESLGVKHVYQNQPDKLPAYEDLKQKLNLNDEQISYAGDDLPDLPLLRRAGLSITVPNAPKLIQQYAYLVTQAKGGRGAVREVCELIMEAQGTFANVIDEFTRR
jgi:3-deoxy-D-manno-octulosonate 8-phosphate phosphatase (KDO 8-P phosphatase)